MDIWFTTEIRWFGKDREVLEQIFEICAGEPVSQPPRTDSYLRTLRHDLSIKIREGRFEVKWLQSALLPLVINEEMCGEYVFANEGHLKKCQKQL